MGAEVGAGVVGVEVVLGVRVGVVLGLRVGAEVGVGVVGVVVRVGVVRVEVVRVGGVRVEVVGEGGSEGWSGSSESGSSG